MKRKVLNLSLTPKAFEMIALGIWLETYRELTPYWVERIMKCVKWCSKGVVRDNKSSRGFKYCYDNLVTGRELCYSRHNGGCVCGNLSDFTKIVNGYTHVRFHYQAVGEDPDMLFEIESISVGYGKTKWDAPEDRKVFIIKLGNRIYDKTN